MQKGDISNTVSPRLLVVFENLVGMLETPTDRAKFDTYKRLHRWKKAVSVFTLNEEFAKYAWDITWRYGYTLDCVTWMQGELADHVESWVDDQGLPFSSFRVYDPNKLARRIATMPDVAAIYDPDPRHRFLFGSKGRILPAGEPNMMGHF